MKKDTIELIDTEKFKEIDANVTKQFTRILDEANKEMDEFIARLAKVDNTIERKFGDYIYKALGTVSSKVVRTPNKHNASIWYGYKGYSKISEIVTNKYFALQPRNAKNIWKIHPDKLFEFIQQEHIDGISNTKKHHCAQDFFTFRTNFLKLLEDTQRGSIHTKVDIPVKLAKIKSVSIKDAFKTSTDYGDNRKSEHFKYIDTYIEGRITDVIVHTSSIEVVDLSKEVDKSYVTRSAKTSVKGKPVPIEIVFVGFDDENKKKKILGTYCFHSDGVLENSYGALLDNTDHSWSSRDHIGVGPSFSVIYKKLKKFGEVITAGEYKCTTGLIVNLPEVLKNKNLRANINKILSFWELASKTFEYLKLKYADMIIMNGNF